MEYQSCDEIRKFAGIVTLYYGILQSIVFCGNQYEGWNCEIFRYSEIYEIVIVFLYIIVNI